MLRSHILSYPCKFVNDFTLDEALTLKLGDDGSASDMLNVSLLSKGGENERQRKIKGIRHVN